MSDLIKIEEREDLQSMEKCAHYWLAQDWKLAGPVQFSADNGNSAVHRLYIATFIKGNP